MKKTLKFVRCATCVVKDLVGKFLLLLRRLPGCGDCAREARRDRCQAKSSCERSADCESTEPR